VQNCCAASCSCCCRSWNNSSSAEGLTDKNTASVLVPLCEFALPLLKCRCSAYAPAACCAVYVIRAFGLSKYRHVFGSFVEGFISFEAGQLLSLRQLVLRRVLSFTVQCVRVCVTGMYPIPVRALSCDAQTVHRRRRCAATQERHSVRVLVYGVTCYTQPVTVANCLCQRSGQLRWQYRGSTEAQNKR
jgi:hypothetical protein